MKLKLEKLGGILNKLSDRVENNHENLSEEEKVFGKLKEELEAMKMVCSHSFDTIEGKVKEFELVNIENLFTEEKRKYIPEETISKFNSLVDRLNNPKLSEVEFNEIKNELEDLNFCLPKVERGL